MKSDPVKIFKDLKKDNKFVSFLHSGNGYGKSILAFNPVETFSGKNIQKFYQFAKKYEKTCKLIGFISYDIGYQLYKIKKTAKDDLKLPIIYFHAYKNWLEFKNSPIQPAKNSYQKNTNNKNFQPEIPKSAYDKAYKKIQHYIKEGEFYQINLTHRLKAKTKIPARELFLRVIEQNPVEHLAYIEGNNFEILSASPERFVQIKNRHIKTCPVKGTRPRGKTKKEDEKFKKELIENEKEKAELNMITDLLRNDLGKICEIGSVKIEGHRLIQKCPTVWHTYSKITGKLAKNYSNLKALIEMLPGGSITGCPKKRAMEVIDELEPVTRSVYTGVIGHIEPKTKDLDFSIAIRTVIKKGNQLYLQVGGGIVYDSKNQAEYRETLQKAASFMEIL